MTCFGPVEFDNLNTVSLNQTDGMHGIIAWALLLHEYKHNFHRVNKAIFIL